MIKKKINVVAEGLVDGLRSLTGRLSPDGRIILVLIMLLFFTGLSLYFTVSSVYNIGKSNGNNMQIEHIERLELQLKQQTDSIK